MIQKHYDRHHPEVIQDAGADKYWRAWEQVEIYAHTARKISASTPRRGREYMDECFRNPRVLMDPVSEEWISTFIQAAILSYITRQSAKITRDDHGEKHFGKPLQLRLDFFPKNVGRRHPSFSLVFETNQHGAIRRIITINTLGMPQPVEKRKLAAGGGALNG